MLPYAVILKGCNTIFNGKDSIFCGNMKANVGISSKIVKLWLINAEIIKKQTIFVTE